MRYWEQLVFKSLRLYNGPCSFDLLILLFVLLIILIRTHISYRAHFKCFTKNTTHLNKGTFSNVIT